MSINGTNGNDSLVGTSGDDTIYGYDGVDTIFGGDGNDQLIPGNGNDSIFGGLGNDQINGYLTGIDHWTYWNSTGDITAYGGDGDDEIFGDQGSDILFGEVGNDFLAGGLGNDSISGGLGNDKLYGDDGNDTLDGGDGNDSLNGGVGNDFLASGLGNDSIGGGLGNDKLYGDDGNDSLDGGDGNDLLSGGSGNDRLIPGNGNDTILGGLGNDQINGYLTGIDQSTYWSSTGDINAYGGDGDDEIFGDKGNDVLFGEVGNDYLASGLGNDSLDGGFGNDTLDGGDGNDSLDGGLGSDTLKGGSGDDIYVIRDSNDFIDDTSGNDTALVYANFVKIPSTIENVVYKEGAQALPYWISALLPDDANGGYFASLLGSEKTYYYVFPSSLPAYDTSTADALGYTPFNDADKLRAISALSYISSLVDLKFVVATNANAANTLTFAYNTQVNSGGYARYPQESADGSDVFIKSSYQSESFANTTYSALTLIHETGHALGLKHPFSHPDADGDIGLPPYLNDVEDDTNWTVMSYDSHPQQYYLKYSELDIAALQYLYGPSKTSRAGSDTYKISSTTSNFIWDGGGVDTLDASELTQSVTLYLTPGYWGFIGATHADMITSPGQVTVNFGTEIENAQGGSGNDTLVGNTANNDLDGGGGNDTLSGGDGNDRFDWNAGLRAGNDVFYGGVGDDIYVFDSALDVAVENASEGEDLLWVNFDYDLNQAPNIEKLMSYSLDKGVNLIGNALSNFLRGDNFDDTLDGDQGVDYALYTESSLDCVIYKTATYCIITTQTEGKDTIKNIEYVQFSDKVVNLSLLALSDSNKAPSGKDGGVSLAEDSFYSLSNQDFGFSDVDGNTLASVRIASLPTLGMLKYNGVAITSSQVLAGYEISASDITAGKMVFVPATNGNGLPYSSFTFQVRDNGGTLGGGLDLDPTPKTFAFNVTPVNDAPTARAEDLLTNEDTSIVGRLPVATDVDGDTVAYTILTKPKSGLLDFADNGNYVYKPNTDFNGVDSFKYEINDGNGGVNSYTINISVKAVNDLPTGTVIISGAATQGQTLTASNTLADVDGLGTISYQWKADGTAIAGATASTLVLGQVQVGKAITVVATYTDGGSTTEAVSSKPSSLIGGVIDGTSAANTLSGTVGADIISGLAGNDSLSGLEGNDRLDGGAGLDRLFGGAGDDTLMGGLGNDNLTGDSGNDYFVFNTKPSASSNKDTINDFESGSDKLQFNQTLFNGLSGAFNVEQFWSGVGVKTAHDSNDRIIYNTSTGALYYDQDGQGGVAAVQIALIGIKVHPSVAFSDIQIIA